MNKKLTLAGVAGLMLAAPALHAQETARVISSIPVLQQVAVPRQVCSTQQVQIEQPKTGAGGLMGAIAGGAVGNQVGGGSGRALATMAGVIGGAILGDRIEGQPAPRLQDQTTCSTQTYYENRTVGYNVTYEYAGRQYQMQMAQDPGPTLPVQVTPMVPGASSQPWQPPLSSPPAGIPARPYSMTAPGTYGTYDARTVWSVGVSGGDYRARPYHPWR